MLTKMKPPYAVTEVDAEKSQQQITALLRKFGVSQINWHIDYERDLVVLEFLIEYEKVEDKSVHKIAVRVSPPTFAMVRRTYEQRSGHYEKKVLANWAQSMRLLYYWIKAKLEAVSWGLNSVEKEFLSDIITLLPDGTNMTVWELIEKDVRDRKLMLESGSDRE